ncbi:hypothetical protein AALA98_17255, partial [Lachnospiraceae bacterium 45-W7]
DDHCPFSIEGWWLFFYPLSYLTLTLNGARGKNNKGNMKKAFKYKKATVRHGTMVFLYWFSLFFGRYEPIPLSITIPSLL